MKKFYKYLSCILLLLLTISLVNIGNRIKSKKNRVKGYSEQYGNAFKLIKKQSTTLFYIDKGYDAYQYFLVHYALAPDKFIVSQEQLNNQMGYDYVLMKDYHTILKQSSFVGDTLFKKKMSDYYIYLIKIKHN